MHRYDDPTAARAWCEARRQEGRTLGFVPTMGALHEGHLELVRRAVAENDLACVSVFVNPLQFDDPADLSRYPRDFERDAELLQGAGCQMVFTGTLAGFFPESATAEGIESEPAGAAAEGLEGACRAGHFDGVATIVRRLFELVVPRRAYFGEKDFQQTLVVRAVAERLGYPQIVVCPTSRESDGLARSSRNLLLTPAERPLAVALSRALARAQSLFAAGERGVGVLRSAMHSELRELEVEYAELRDPERFERVPTDVDRLDRAQALVAARLGRVRLIDNLRLDGPPLASLRSGGACGPTEQA
ncbi:pantoate--beta-alanine ligase [Engelhardtia mirabilis]|uniref:Pantothenate synthetase n=1 Tax=Engelhardtia mirabilis TaxID=2528011 RepID=A0A518BML2_9BACT|nr:Pantoate-beta-alanine ligase [Planctomycetes bacterium Pla133]QDV02545.1 Pantoate-beta-alanine ligase [Planctomycetes bacterium Pla86]